MNTDNKPDPIFQQLFEQSADAHLIIENNRFVDCNPATVKMLGYSNKSDLLETHPSELSPPLQPDGRHSDEKADEMMALARDKGTHRFEWDHVRANGAVFPVEVLLTSLNTAEGKNLIHTVWRDISERKHRERSLRESEENFRSVVTNSNAVIFILDPEGTFLLSEGRGLKMLGLQPGEVVGRKAQAVYADYPDIVENIELALKGTEIEKTLAVDELIFRVHFNPLKNEAGKVSSVIGIANDVSEQMRLQLLQETLRGLAEDLLTTTKLEDIAHTSAEVLREFFHSDALSIWYNDFENQVTRSLHLEDTPSGAEEPKTFPPENIQFSDDDPLEVHSTAHAFLDNRTEDQLQKKNLEQPFGDRTRMSASILYVPITREGSKIGVISVHSYTLNQFSERDLEALQSFADQIGTALQRALIDQDLTRSLEEKNVLLRELQHRTKNNMNVILSLMNMQMRENPHPELESSYRQTKDRIMAMSLVYDQLQKTGRFTSILLRDYLKSLSNNLYRSLIHHPERVHLELDCEDVTISLEQAVPIGIILNETLTNALKHAFPAEESGRIRILVKQREDGRALRLRIEDNGVGLTPLELEEAQQSMGFRLVRMLVEDQLHGKHVVNLGKGICHIIDFELDGKK